MLEAEVILYVSQYKPLIQILYGASDGICNEKRACRKERISVDAMGQTQLESILYQ
jgi:hypothetical protein